MKTEHIRNVVLLGHSGAGKTSLADAMFFISGGSTRQGKVDEKNSYSDFEPEEQQRGSSAQLALLPCEWKGAKINVLDTPGYADFQGEMLCGLQVADAAIIVVSAPSGVEVGADQAREICDRLNLPTLVVINKLDRENTDFKQATSEIATRWDRSYTPIQVPNGSESSFTKATSLVAPEPPEGTPSDMHEQLIEMIAETTDELTLKYLEGEVLSSEELSCGLKSAVFAGSVRPVLPTSITNNAGVENLLDTIIDLFPSPQEAQAREGAPEIPDGALASLVFKTSADPFVGKLSFFRVYGAPMKADSQAWNQNRSENERWGQIFTPQGKEQVPTKEIVVGDIGVVPKLSVTRTFDTICDKSTPINLPSIDMPEPVYALAVKPESNADVDKMATALPRLEDEDPSLRVERNADTAETVIRGLGDLHVEIAIDRLKRKFGVSLKTSTPRIPYRETITASTKSEYRHKKQSGGHGQYGHVVIELVPRSRGEGFSFTSKVVGGNVPREYIPAVEKGVQKSMSAGAIAGFPIVDLDVRLLDGSSHPVDSSGMSFEIAGSFALRNGVQTANPVLLEPVMKMNVTIPDDSTGEVIGDLNTRRGRILGMNPLGDGITLIEADAPMALIQTYATDLRALTQARGTFSVSFGYYDTVPPNEAEKVILNANSEKNSTAD